MISRREALQKLTQFLLASPLFCTKKFASEADPMMDLFNIFDFAKLAQSRLDPVAWDYLDEGGEDEVALQDNRKAFDQIIIRPRVLTDVHKIDVSTNLLGKKLDYPIFICPAGGKNCFHKNGEEEVAKAAVESHALMITSGGVDSLLASGRGPKNWWQYTLGGELKSRSTLQNFVGKLEDSGCSGISITLDSMHVSHRERSIHNKFVRQWCDAGIPRDAQGKLVYGPEDTPWRTGIYPERPYPTPVWDDIRKLRDTTDLPVILKGILTAQDTEKSVQAGVSAIIVSNHGGRQLDHVGGTIEALPECVQAAGGKIPVLIDGGFRRGTDILKALALGAAAVGIARPYLWGLVSFGSRGVARVIELLRSELALDMGMAGAAKISQLDRSFVRLRKP